MLFNSIDFAIFFPIVFILYWFVTNHNVKLQNSLIAVVSYIFYGWWDWRFLGLIFFSTTVDFIVGWAINREVEDKKRKRILAISLVLNICLLGFFKYFNFFADSFANAFTFFGYQMKVNAWSIVLPVGLSFYTFQSMSYTIDVYRRKLQPATDFVTFCAFVSFFPLLVAGPIVRATHLLPQFYAKRTFDYQKAADGMRQILWGLFKKIVIADNASAIANNIFNHSQETGQFVVSSSLYDPYTGSTLVLGAFFFAFQIYCDFSGYSDIAIGTSRLLGFSLMKNFAFPYFSRDIAEFWRRWHISLSTWFRDYLYIPLGGSKGGTWSKVRNTFIVFVVSGFWHGAKWTFVAWGALNAIYFLPLLLFNKNRQNLDVVAQGKQLPSLREAFNVMTTFALVVFAWIFFRASDMSHAFSYIATIFSPSLFSVPHFPGKTDAVVTLSFITFFLIIEWMGRDQEYAIAELGLTWKSPVRWAMYYGLILIIFYYSGKQQEFIYFQF